MWATSQIADSILYGKDISIPTLSYPMTTNRGVLIDRKTEETISCLGMAGHGKRNIGKHYETKKELYI